ncbi:MAG: 16S rRNA (cytosine(967)-C(5))-methyltransferase RsmB [Betaproteobacteria bacterium]|nr:MAG: 16S rRNA (cytosine(967)-C(5))-methyltransferase RsmB [Betaproteobacteria bacterium]
MERAQRVAAKAVRRVLAGTPLAKALATEGELGRDDRALIHELAYGTLRFLGQLKAIVRALANRPLADANVEALLWVALYQLMHTTAPVHVVVDCAVRATPRVRRTSAKGMVNAILRNFLRRRDPLLAQVARDPEARFSYPHWWIERVRADYPERFTAILDAGNARPPLCLRVNARRIAREAFVAMLETHGIGAKRVGSAGVSVDTPRPATALPGYAEGAFSVQDAAAQLAAPLLGVGDGMRVLDACAAPGGKTTHLAELATLELTALDVDSARLERVAENLARLGLSARLVAGDAGNPDAWWNGTPFDRILADVPCTASGVVRRHPDGKWLRRESDLASFVLQQQRLLDALWPMVARGGRLLYSTCSVFHAENADQVRAFVARHPDAACVDLDLPSSLSATDGQLLPVEGDAEHNHDGFFYALLEKS